MLKAGIIWITGIPASGKTTLSHAIYIRLRQQGAPCEVIDGDEIRAIMAPKSGFSQEDRSFQVGRIMYVARALARNGTWAVVAAVSPFEAHRAQARTMAEGEGIPFFEVHANCPVEVAVARDPKGLYAKAKAGEISDLTGYNAPYEAPTHPDVVVDTSTGSPHDGAEKVADAALWRLDLNPPVILLGKGGGGTRMLSSLGQDLGIWIGKGPNVSESQDSLEWVELIYRLVQEVGCNHEFPSGSRYQSEIREHAFWTLKNNEVPLGTRWGWKLPETMFLLPIFLDAFPAAKIVHLVEHPVSASLKSSHITSEPEHPVGRDTLPASYRHVGRDPKEMLSDEPWMRNAIAYAHQVSRIVYYARALLSKEQYLEVRFEDICRNPDDVLWKMAGFLKITPPRVKGSPYVNQTRIPSWDPADPKAAGVWEICGNIGELLGYRKDSPQ